jgi:hypothetical protein
MKKLLTAIIALAAIAMSPMALAGPATPSHWVAAFPRRTATTERPTTLFRWAMDFTQQPTTTETATTPSR